MRAAGARSEYFRSRWILLGLRRSDVQGHESRRVLRGLGRFTAVPQELVIEWSPAGYVVLGDTLAVEQQAAQAAVLDLLPDSDGRPLSEGDLLEATGGTIARSTLRRALDKLVDQGGARRRPSGAGKTGRAQGYVLSAVSTLGRDPGQSSTDDVPSRDVRSLMSATDAPSGDELSSPLPLDGHNAQDESVAARAPALREARL
jgi:hypothetical protein